MTTPLPAAPDPEKKRKERALTRAILWWLAIFFIGGTVADSIFSAASDGAGDLAKGIVGIGFGALAAFLIYKRELRKPLL